MKLEEIKRLYHEDKLTLAEIANRYGYKSPVTILNFMVRHNIPRRPRGSWVVTTSANRDYTGKSNPGWKGGRRGHVGGYILIHKPQHPHAYSDGYIFEHRLIIEEYLKCYLEPHLVVHHINGIKDDNRLENLQVFGSQGEHSSYHRRVQNAD